MFEGLRCLDTFQMPSHSVFYFEPISFKQKVWPVKHLSLLLSENIPFSEEKNHMQSVSQEEHCGYDSLLKSIVGTTPSCALQGYQTCFHSDLR